MLERQLCDTKSLVTSETTISSLVSKAVPNPSLRPGNGEVESEG
jgi:hypothetical protein